MPAFTGTRELELGGAFEEFQELLRGHLERDEYHRAMLKAQEVQIGLLRQQLGATESIELVGDPGGGGTTSVTYEGNVQTLGLGEFVVAETDDLEASNADGSLTVPADGVHALVRHRAEGEGAALLSLGASDAAETEFAIRADGDIIGGWTQSPLGTIVNPFSLVNQLNAVIAADGSLEYVARRTDDAAGGVDLAGRAFVEDM